MTLVQQIAYLAGVIDGEGCLQIVATGKGQYTTPRLDIVQNDRRMLETLKQRHGGSIYQRDKNGMRGFCWVLMGKGLMHWLRLVHPILIVKADQAEAIIHLKDTELEAGGNKAFRGKGRLVPQEIKDLRESTRQRLRELKRAYRRSVAEEQSSEE